jgi:hypothetical protein
VRKRKKDLSKEKGRGGKRFDVLLFLAIKLAKSKYILLSSQNMGWGSGIRDPEKTYLGSGSGVKKEPDPQH